MTRRSQVLVSLVVVACQTSGDANKAGDGKAGPAGPAVDANAAGGAVGPVGAVAECPKSLGGTEKLHRVISRDCGVVPVTSSLQIEGGSLTLEAGASLAFQDGTGLIVGYNEPAKLIVKGTAEAPVVFTSAGDKAAGVWQGVALHSFAARSSLEGLVIEYAGGDDQPALKVGAADVMVTGSTIRDSKAGVVVPEGGSFAAFTGNEFKKIGKPAAIEVLPAAVGGLGGGNRFDPGAFVLVQNGSLRKSAKWQPVGAPLVIAADVSVDGEAGQRTTLELAPGLELKFSQDATMTVGYYEHATLTAKGTADAPITFTAQDRREPGAWRGLRVHGNGELTLAQAVLEFGGRDGEGVVWAKGGSLAMTGTTLRSDLVAVDAATDAKLTAFADNKFVATPIAVRLPANLVGGLGEGNAFDRDAKIVVGPETIKEKTTWRAQPVALELVGNIAVEAELTLEAGLSMLAGPEVEIRVGFYGPAALLATGTAAEPVTIGPNAAGGMWMGIVLHGNAVANKLEYLTLTGVLNPNAIDLQAKAGATLNHVTCSRCAGAVVGWACEAQVSSSQVLAADGTPKIDAKPEGC